MSGTSVRDSASLITLYGRPGCHLCEQAHAILSALAPALGFALRTVDVGSDSALEARYGERIPVVVAGGREVLAWPFTRAAARQALIRGMRDEG
jgi:glutaredoxin